MGGNYIKVVIVLCMVMIKTKESDSSKVRFVISCLLFSSKFLEAMISLNKKN